MEELLALLGLGGGGLLVGDAYNKLDSTGETAWEQSQRIGADAAENTRFKGYGVTGPTGTTTVAPDGSTSMMLSPEQQAYADRFRNLSTGVVDPTNPMGIYSAGAFNTAGGLLGGISADPTQRENDIYSRIRAMQLPEEQRAEVALNSRLAEQGRTGVTTGSFGGTPEQLAMQKAIAEGRNSASYEAIRLAMEGKGQDANIAGMLSESGNRTAGTQGELARLYGALQYAPQSATLDMFNAGSNAYGYEDIARRQAGNQLAESEMGGLEALLGARLGQANLSGNLGSSLISGSLGMLSSSLANGGTGIEDFLRRIGIL